MWLSVMMLDIPLGEGLAGFFVYAPGVHMAVMAFRRRPRWVRAVVSMIAFMRLHYADRR